MIFKENLFLKVLLPVIFISFLLVDCVDEKTQTNWYKGNLHTHSYWSDGDDYPEMIMKWYKDSGYDFVTLSDHNILAEGEKWIEPEKGTQHEQTFQNYLDTFGEDWIVFEENQGHYRVLLKTLEEYRTLFEDEGRFLILKSEEITDGFENKSIHVNATNVQELIEPQGGNSIVDVMQNNIDAVYEQREETGEPMFPHINHPNFGWSITAEDLKGLEGERFFEVYNGHPHVHNEGDSLRSGTEQMWDEVITHYLIEGKPVMYGIAVDDAHHYQEMSTENANPGRGWIQVKSHELSPDSIIAAMERGDFYASNGVSVQSIKFDGHTLTINIDDEEGVQYTTEFIGTRDGSETQIGSLLETKEGPKVSYTLKGDEMYVRAKITSDKKKENPYSPGEFEVAWIQPVVPENK